MVKATAEWTVVSTDKKKAVGLIMQKHVIPNTQYACYRAKGLDEAKKYHFYNRKLQYDIKEFGELVNMVSPIHIKQGSMLQDILSKLRKWMVKQKIHSLWRYTYVFGCQVKAGIQCNRLQ